MKTVTLFFLLLSGVGQCSEQDSIVIDPLAPVIRSGTSFGMCRGYCVKEMEIVGNRATFTKVARQQPDKFPKKSCQKILTQNKADAILSLASFESFRKLPERVGCPDCTDGGAEYIELEQGGIRHRVTFEYGKTIPGFNALVQDLRAQRAQFETCN